MFERSGLSSGPGGGFAAAGAGLGVGLVAGVELLGGVLAAAAVEADFSFCFACAFAKLAAEARMLAVVGYVDGSDPDGTAEAGAGAVVEVDAGSEDIAGGIDAPAKAPAAGPALAPNTPPGPLAAAADGMVGRGDAI